ncbi:SDR family oxidoreductase [Paenibacillus sp. FSL K6-1096]|uniref:SDR family oxidoreductase n=1 Tax=Paenibacillus sp. FSL K6-1096 TaxID=2921460 RepID=UPI0030EC9CAE
MNLKLKGKNVLVAASSKGIGRAVAEEFAAEGANVALCSRNEEQLRKTAEEIRERYGVKVYSLQADLTVKADIEAFVQGAVSALGGLDVLVTNSGGPPGGTFEEMEDEQWEKAFQQNLMSVIRLIRGALPHLKQSGAGRIANIASISVKQPIDGLILSNTFRTGIAGLAKTLAGELAPYGILINTVGPGRIATDRTLYLDGLKAEARQVPIEEIRAESERSVPLHRYGQPEEIARMIVFLCSEANSYSTGQTVMVDGGLVRGL